MEKKAKQSNTKKKIFRFEITCLNED